MSVSLCVLRIEIDEDLPEMGDNPSEMGKTITNILFNCYFFVKLCSKLSNNATAMLSKYYKL